MKSPSEELCKDSFHRFMVNRFPDSIVSWHEVAKKDEPPDFYLVADGIRYAVEVTQLMHKVNVGKARPLPVKTVVRLLKKFVAEQVESVARESNYLHGSYLVSFSRPVDDFANLRGTIQSKLLEYIRSTRLLSNAPGKVVYKRGRQECTIEKTSNRGDKVFVGGPWSSRWEGEAARDVGHLLESSLRGKEHKLRNISSPKVLLLQDEYHFADRETYKSCISSIASLASFHTVFLVESNGQGLVLCSLNQRWS